MKKKKEKRRNIRKNLALAVMGGMLAISCLGMSQKYVMASNVNDTSWSFSLGLNANNFQYIAGREKTDATKIYIYWNSTYGGNLSQIQVYACGASSQYGSPIDASRSTPSNNPYYAFMYGTKKYSLTSYVYEINHSNTSYNGALTYARPGMKSIKGSGTAVGVWSPDSINTYNIIP